MGRICTIGGMGIEITRFFLSCMMVHNMYYQGTTFKQLALGEMPMPRALQIKLDSSAIENIAYDPNAELLNVTFHSGRTYTYAEVPTTIVSGLVRAKSAGRYFSQKIKGHFPTI